MRLFGLEVRKADARPILESRGGWWPLVREPFAGAWQRNVEWTHDTILAHHAVYACITLISSDIGKLRTKLVEQDAKGIWSEVQSAAFSPVLRKPNRFQNHIQFKEWWITSKLMRGNAYVLKVRDRRGVVTSMYLLDPTRVEVLVSTDGAVFYKLLDDKLSGLEEGVTVPASEIIHDRMNCLFHPLVGISPIYASGLAAHVGIQIENNAAHFFGKGSNPSGILTAPKTIDDITAKRLSETWNANFSGENSGKVAVLGDGLKFEALRMSAVDSQMIEHLKWTAEVICSAFHVPAFKIGAGTMPTYQNAEILNQIYYSDCLQAHIESMELCLDEGLGLTDPSAQDGKTLGTELDLDTLLRMDTATQYKTLGDGIAAALLTPNEARAKIDRQPLPGGDTAYMQQQNYSLAALNKRDAKEDPFASANATAPAAPPPAPPAGSGKSKAVRRAADVFSRTLKAAA